MQRRQYRDLLAMVPPAGETEHGEIQNTANPNELAAGVGHDFGILYSDRYITLVRDPVVFPSFDSGGHLRIFEGYPENKVFGVVILAVRFNARNEMEVRWIRQWRHPVNAWTSEIPRGTLGLYEQPYKGALRELEEETGSTNPWLMVHLGDMPTNTGISSSIAAFYLAVLPPDGQEPKMSPNSNEVIAGKNWYRASDWRKAIADAPPNADRPHAFLDALTAAAFGLAMLTGSFENTKRAWESYVFNLMTAGEPNTVRIASSPDGVQAALKAPTNDRLLDEALDALPQMTLEHRQPGEARVVIDSALLYAYLRSAYPDIDCTLL